MNKPTENKENKEIKEALESLNMYEEIWIDSLKSNLLRIGYNTFILSLYDYYQDKFLSHTIINRKEGK